MYQYSVCLFQSMHKFNADRHGKAKHLKQNSTSHTIPRIRSIQNYKKRAQAGAVPLMCFNTVICIQLPKYNPTARTVVSFLYIESPGPPHPTYSILPCSTWHISVVYWALVIKSILVLCRDQNHSVPLSATAILGLLEPELFYGHKNSYLDIF